MHSRLSRRSSGIKTMLGAARVRRILHSDSSASELEDGDDDDSFHVESVIRDSLSPPVQLQCKLSEAAESVKTLTGSRAQSHPVFNSHALDWTPSPLLARGPFQFSDQIKTPRANSSWNAMHLQLNVDTRATRDSVPALCLPDLATHQSNDTHFSPTNAQRKPYRKSHKSINAGKSYHSLSCVPSKGARACEGDEMQSFTMSNIGRWGNKWPSELQAAMAGIQALTRDVRAGIQQRMEMERVGPDQALEKPRAYGTADTIGVPMPCYTPSEVNCPTPRSFSSGVYVMPSPRLGVESLRKVQQEAAQVRGIFPRNHKEFLQRLPRLSMPDKEESLWRTQCPFDQMGEENVLPGGMRACSAQHMVEAATRLQCAARAFKARKALLLARLLALGGRPEAYQDSKHAATLAPVARFLRARQSAEHLWVREFQGLGGDTVDSGMMAIQKGPARRLWWGLSSLQATTLALFREPGELNAVLEKLAREEEAKGRSMQSRAQERDRHEQGQPVKTPLHKPQGRHSVPDTKMDANCVTNSARGWNERGGDDLMEEHGGEKLLERACSKKEEQGAGDRVFDQATVKRDTCPEGIAPDAAVDVLQNAHVSPAVGPGIVVEPFPTCASSVKRRPPPLEYVRSFRGSAVGKLALSKGAPTLPLSLPQTACGHAAKHVAKAQEPEELDAQDCLYANANTCAYSQHNNDQQEHQPEQGLTATDTSVQSGSAPGTPPETPLDRSQSTVPGTPPLNNVELLDESGVLCSTEHIESHDRDAEQGQVRNLEVSVTGIVREPDDEEIELELDQHPRGQEASGNPNYSSQRLPGELHARIAAHECSKNLAGGGRAERGERNKQRRRIKSTLKITPGGGRNVGMKQDEEGSREGGAKRFWQSDASRRWADKGIHSGAGGLGEQVLGKGVGGINCARPRAATLQQSESTPKASSNTDSAEYRISYLDQEETDSQVGGGQSLERRSSGGTGDDDGDKACAFPSPCSEIRTFECAASECMDSVSNTTRSLVLEELDCRMDVCQARDAIASQPSPAEQEAVAHALGALVPNESIAQGRETQQLCITESAQRDLRIAALNETFAFEERFVEPRQGVALYAFAGTDEDELSLNKGQLILLVGKAEEDWYIALSESGASGLVPVNYVDIMSVAMPSLASVDSAGTFPSSSFPASISDSDSVSSTSAELASRQTLGSSVLRDNISNREATRAAHSDTLEAGVLSDALRMFEAGAAGGAEQVEWEGAGARDTSTRSRDPQGIQATELQKNAFVQELEDGISD